MLVTALFALVPSAVIIFFSRIIPESYIVLFSILVFAVLTYSFYSVENVFTKLEKVFFPRKHYLQSSIKTISKKLESITNLRDLKDLILTDIVNTLEVYGGAIVLVYQQSVETFAAGDIDVDEAERLVLSGETEHEEFGLFPVVHNEEYSSYLVVTRKRTNTLLSLEEKRWLTAIISYLAVSLENLHLIRKLTVNLQQLAAHVPNEEESRELNWFRKVTFELQESERKRIANDLHDTTMQDLFFLKRKLQELFNDLELEGLHSRKAEHLLEHIDIINATLRESFFELHPHLLQEIGLVKTIRKVVDKEKYDCPFEINYHVFGREEIERFDLETKRHIFRIVQELFNNAKKHSQARHVSLSLVVDEGTFRLDYRDDGVGFEPRRRATQEIGASGMGMEYMKSRALYLGGTFSLNTAPGKGMKLTITLPTDKPHLKLVYDKDHA
jgi:two-component system sensor histidine kinase ComP